MAHIQAIKCVNTQTPFVLSIGGEEHIIISVSTHRVATMTYGEIDKVVFNVIGNQWVNAIELQGQSLVCVYRNIA